MIALNSIAAASHWLDLDKFKSEVNVTSWTDEALDIYHYTVITQEVCTRYDWLFLISATLIPIN